MKIASLLCLLSLATITACLTPPPARPAFKPLTEPSIVAAATNFKHDDFKKLTTYQGVSAQEYTPLYLRAWKLDSSGLVEYQIYVSFYDSEWRFYNEAYDSNGNKMSFTSIERRVDSCSGGRGCYMEEIVGLNVTRKYLEESQESGIQFKVSGKNGEKVRFLPAAYVRGFLMSVDKS